MAAEIVACHSQARDPEGRPLQTWYELRVKKRKGARIVQLSHAELMDIARDIVVINKERAANGRRKT